MCYFGICCCSQNSPERYVFYKVVYMYIVWYSIVYGICLCTYCELRLRLRKKKKTRQRHYAAKSYHMTGMIYF